MADVADQVLGLRRAPGAGLVLVHGRGIGELAEGRSLRGFDAIHLAIAIERERLTDTPGALLCFDDRLRAAAVAEGLRP